MGKIKLLLLIVSSFFILGINSYDPQDEKLRDILLPEGQFEAFYRKGLQSKEENAARPPHNHASFHAYRHPGLVDVPNSAAYGFRFDGKRRFNYD